MKLFIFVIMIAGLSTIAESVDPTEDAPTISPTPTNKIVICTGRADVILLLDRSGSVGDLDFGSLLAFAIHLARTFNISQDKVRLGVASYADHATRDIELNTFGFTNFKNQIDQMSRGTEDLTNVHAGLLKAEEMLEDASNGARNDPETVKLIVVTNDGPANRGMRPLPTAERIRNKGIKIVSIGIEEDVSPQENNHQETQGLASDPNLYYFVPHYIGLAEEGFLKNVTKAVCSIVTVTPVIANNVNESIHENTTINTNIHKIPVFNGGEHNIPQYHIINPDPALPFRVDINGNIIVTGMLDRETKDVYIFLVRITDINIPDYSETVRVTIHLLDVNDNDPIPINNKVEYTIELYENNTFNPPEAVFTVSAIDIDIGLNGEIMYILTGGNGDNRFQLLPDSGELQLHNALDRETKDSYTLTAVAKDKGNPSRSSVDITINVIVKDVNDNAPTPTKAVVYLEYPENQPIGNLRQLIADDLDIGVNGQFIFVFADTSGNEGGKFGLNMNTGYLSLVNSLNYEDKQSYTLHIVVEDEGSPKLYSPITVHVDVTNIDEPPTIIASLHRDIPENFGKTDAVLTVSVDDPENELISYQIVQTSPFSIDVNGDIKVSGAIDREGPVYQYTLTIEATVGGHTVNTTASINILDVNDEYPTFSENQYVGLIEEHSNEGSLAGDLASASDDDATSPNNNFTFAISAGNINDAFEIDPNTGVITVNNPDALDFEAIPQFILTLTVTDEGTSPLSTNTTYVINLYPTNEPPGFKAENDTINLEFAENQTLGNLYQFNADDNDTGVNGIVTYTIESSDGNGKFSLDMNSGILTLVSSFNFEEKNSYKLIVKAEDGGFPRLHTLVTVYIKILDIDYPLTINGSFSERILENFTKSDTIVTVTATDPENSAITYSIMEMSPFAIDGSGQITLVGDIDRESDIYNYSLTIKASAGAHTVQTTVKIAVDDVNDNAPTFTEINYTGNIFENAAIGTEVTTSTPVGASDDDATSPNNQFTFMIVHGNINDAFTMNPNTGIVSLNGQIDFDTQNKYFLTIRVSDKGDPEMHAYAPYIINIIDAQEPPYFTNGPFDLCIDENLPTGTPVFTASAEDANNDPLTFSISPTVNLPFQINANTGEVTTTTSIDAEQFTRFDFTISVSDGKASVSISASVCINDLNEHSPIFAPVIYNVKIPDGSGSSTFVVNVTAKDADPGINGEIVYSIIAGNVNGDFTINPNTGRIEVVNKVDCQVTETYTLTVRATDKGSPVKISNPDATVIITLMKMNVTVCECVLPQTSYPCIKWTKYEIIRKFDGKCYLDKLKAAIVHMTAKIEMVKNLIEQFNTCKGELRQEINLKTGRLSYADLFKRYDNCVVNSQCKLTKWQIQLEQKKMQLEKEKVIEEEGWGTFNIPGSDYMKAFYDMMKKSRSSHW